MPNQSQKLNEFLEKNLKMRGIGEVAPNTVILKEKAETVIEK